MHRVIYADVLVAINIYITYFLLRSTSLISKEKPDRIRLLLSCFLGGIFSLTVLLPEEAQLISVLLRIPSTALFIFIAFGFRSLRVFLRLNISFLFCGFIYAGLMLALWYFICPAGMYFNGAVVYFDIDILTLVAFTIVCYAFVEIFDRFFKRRAPVNTLFECVVFIGEYEYSLRAFLDTGNHLVDCFTGKPVIIASREALKESFSREITLESDLAGKNMRFIFCNTVGGDGLLPAFTPEKVKIKGASYDFVTEEAVIAVTEKRLMQGEYDAILPVGLFENISYERDACENEKNTLTV